MLSFDDGNIESPLTSVQSFPSSSSIGLVHVQITINHFSMDAYKGIPQVTKHHVPVICSSNIIGFLSSGVEQLKGTCPTANQILILP